MPSLEMPPSLPDLPRLVALSPDAVASVTSWENNQQIVRVAQLTQALDAAQVDYSRWGMPGTGSKPLSRLQQEIAERECVIKPVSVAELKQAGYAGVTLPENGQVLLRELIPVMTIDIYTAVDGKVYRLVEAGQVRFTKLSPNEFALDPKQRNFLRGGVAEKPKYEEAGKILETGEIPDEAALRAVTEETPALGLEVITRAQSTIAINEQAKPTDTYPGLLSRSTVFCVPITVPAPADVAQPILTYETHADETDPEAGKKPDKVTVFVWEVVSDLSQSIGQRAIETFGQPKMDELLQLVHDYAQAWREDPALLNPLVGETVAEQWKLK